MSIELKIKSKSLAAEARIIRAEEVAIRDHIRSRSKRQLPSDRLSSSRNSLYHHRIAVVRSEARATFLARAFIKGLPRSAVEAQPSPSYIESRSYKIAKKYAPTTTEPKVFEAWMAGEVA